jgi:hypothetical protein
LCVDVGHGGAGSATFVVGDALGHALVRPVGCQTVSPALTQFFRLFAHIR